MSLRICFLDAVCMSRAVAVGGTSGRSVTASALRASSNVGCLLWSSALFLSLASLESWRRVGFVRNGLVVGLRSVSLLGL